jgi:hypothetical protein
MISDHAHFSKEDHLQKGIHLSLLTLVLYSGFLFVILPDAHAIPAFARKYDVSCTMCHIAFPKLNDFGVNFRDNGYQMGATSDLPTSLEKGYFPLSFRSTVGYQYQKSGNVPNPVSGNPYDLTTSGFGSLGIDFLSGGTLDRDISYLIVPTGVFSNLGGAATFSLESAWIRFDNISGNPLLNFKIGKGDLDLPFSAHRSFTILTPYLIYTYSPTLLDAFAFADHQGVAQLEGNRLNSIGTFRYAVNLVSNNTYGGHDTGYYLHFTQSLGGGGYSSGYRGGLFYLSMPMPTTSDGVNPISNPIDPTLAATTGGSSRPISKYGVDLSGNFFENKLNIFGVFLQGKDDKDLALIANAQDASYWGGFVEANFLFNPKLVLLGRYDIIRNTTQADPSIVTTPSDKGDQDSITISARYAISLHNRGEIWFHGEANTVTSKDTGLDMASNPINQVNNTLFLGLDFAY